LTVAKRLNFLIIPTAVGMQLILEHEIKVTKSINNLVDQTFNAKDFATFCLMQWYVSDQREEERCPEEHLSSLTSSGKKELNFGRLIRNSESFTHKLHPANNSKSGSKPLFFMLKLGIVLGIFFAKNHKNQFF